MQAKAKRELSTDVECDAAPPDAHRLVADLSALISPPTVCVKMFELVQSARASAGEIGEIVALDPNLAARLLRIVNSSFYAFPSRIDSIARAITILGTRDLCNLVLAIAAVRSFTRTDAGLVSMTTFWHHSIFCALVTRLLAKHYRLPDADRLFVAGLLHDVGTCVMYHQMPDWVPRMRPVLAAGEGAVCAAEREQFGFDHGAVGALVLAEWQLPDELAAAVRHHHDPAAATTARAEAALVHLADALAGQSQAGALCPAAGSELQIDETIWDVLGDGPESLDVARILQQANAGFGDAVRALLPAKRR